MKYKSDAGNSFMPQSELARYFVKCGFKAIWHTKPNLIMDERIEPEVDSYVISVFENNTGSYTNLLLL